ncbi:ABC transporter permease [Pelagibius litoralis]|uniref:ABC transporter permease n=1 Tax=Pelagibius litoralis TaxID=374515 RepID=A0A967F0W2_9PROT|nr:ABC transporter permease [Pelagibius litoralis]NIA70973.1 ABC transporter permease [Pelagibius litoralis]
MTVVSSTQGSDTTSDEEGRVFVETPLRRFISDFSESWLALAGLVMFLTIVSLAVFAPLIAPQDPYDLSTLDLLDSKLKPGELLSSGQVAWLGTDGLGRDILSAIMYGLRISLAVGASSAFIALFIGASIGLAAAYAGGRVDAIIMRIVDIQLSFPSILIGLVLIAVLGSGTEKIIVALVAVQWAYYARTVRGTALVERRKEYIEAARCLALSSRVILFQHLLPNCLPPLIVLVTVQVAHSIALEASLSFLGVGLPVTEPSLGRLIANGFEYMMSGKYWISFFPGLALLFLILSINLVGDQVRDVLNPRLQR